MAIFSRIGNYLSLIKFSHTIFALPFALLGFFLAVLDAGSLQLRELLLVILCMVFARSAAMAFNRWQDRDIDGKNPRTAVREIPAGVISSRAALGFIVLNCGLFILCAGLLNPLCLWLSPVALLVILGYSYTKRFTYLCHFVLGLGLALAPVGAYLAVTAQWALLPVLYGVVVLLWVAGFDIIYALQDEGFDREEALFSIPVRLGTVNALRLGRLLHLVCASVLIGALVYQGLGRLASGEERSLCRRQIVAGLFYALVKFLPQDQRKLPTLTSYSVHPSDHPVLPSMRLGLLTLVLFLTCSLAAQSYKSRIHYKVKLGDTVQLHQLILLDYTKLLGTALEIDEKNIRFKVRSAAEVSVIPTSKLRFLGVFRAEQPSSGRRGANGPAIGFTDLTYEPTALPYGTKAELKVINLIYATTEWSLNENYQIGVGLAGPLGVLLTQRARWSLSPVLHVGVSNKMMYVPLVQAFEERLAFLVHRSHDGPR